MALSLLAPVAGQAAIINVSPGDSIQDAIDAAFPGDEVVLATGRYWQRIDFTGKAITVRSTDPTNPGIVAVTIIDGSAGGSVVTFTSGEGSGSVLEGLTIANGTGTPLGALGDLYGGGIYCDQSSPTIAGNRISGNSGAWGGSGICSRTGGSPTISDNTINGNRAETGGAGIFCEGGAPIISGNTVTDNTAASALGFGAGVLCMDSTAATVSDNRISGNTAGWTGGGMYLDGDFAGISGNTINANAAYMGGGILCAGSGAISRNVIDGNSATRGGGIHCLSTSSPKISSCTISGNSASDGGGSYCSGGAVSITNSIIAFSGAGGGIDADSGSVVVTYCDAYGNAGGNYLGMADPTGTDGNISVDPLFAHAAIGDYHLRSGAGRWDPVILSWVTDPIHSPCIDAGDPLSAYSNEPAPNGGRTNMGVYGNTPEASKTANRAPTAPTTVYVTPSGPRTEDDLAALGTGATDPDGDPLTYAYEWAKTTNGGASWSAWSGREELDRAAADGGSDSVLDHRLTAKGEEWKARARAYDGTDYGPWAESDPVTIGNTAPSSPDKPTTSPSSPQTGDDLTLSSGTGSTDPDTADTITYEYEWARVGTSTWIPGQTLPSSNTAEGEQWKGRVRAYDGTEHSSWVESDPVTIGNTAPSSPDKPTISPGSPKTEDDLTLSDGTGSTDPDNGDTVTYEFQWSKLGSGSWIDGKTLPSSSTAEGEQWKGRIRATDGTDESNWVQSDPVIVGNTGPSDPDQPTISPSNPRTEDDLTLSEGAGSTDPDAGDTITYEYQWSKDNWATSILGQTLLSPHTAEGDEWKGHVRAYDGTDYSGWVESDPVTIGDTGPTVPTAVTIDRGSPQTEDDLTASATGSTDPDGDPVSYEYEWCCSTDGGPWSAWGWPGSTLPCGETTNRQQWKTRACATADGQTSGWAESDPVTIGNSAPMLDWVGQAPFRADGHDPQRGLPVATQFTFRVKITDPDDAPPRRMFVRIQRLEDGRRWRTMSTLPLQAVSGTWVGGMICEAKATLPNGVHRHLFYARDDRGAAATGEPRRWHTGPRIVATPQLWCTGLAGRQTDFLEPETGIARETRFGFAVQYTDGEGTLPHVYRLELQKKHPDGKWHEYTTAEMRRWSGIPSSGVYYGYQRKLRAGEYRHRFVFEDDNGMATGNASQGPNATRWQAGPVVSETTLEKAAGAAALSSLAALPSPTGAHISFSLSTPMAVDTRILNIAGRPIKTLCRAKDCDAGSNTLIWNAHSDTDLPVPNGTYLVEVTAKAGDGTQARALGQVRLRR